MSFRVNTNVASLQSREYLRQTTESQGKTISRVTSGLRIIASGDDAAGLAIANGFRSDQAVLSQGVRNANDGLSTLQTLDGGINNISKLLDRARTLATQSASGTFTGDRGVLDTEFSSVIGEIDRQAQAVGLTTGGAFARSLSVFIGGGRSANGISTTTNGSVGVDLSSSTVDSKSLGLKGVQAQGVSSVDIGTGSASTSVSAIVSDATNTGSTAVGGFTDFYFKGPGFSDGERIKVAVNLSGVTNVDNLATNINAAIDSAGAASSQQATAFKNSGVRATVVTDSTGKKSLGFTSASSAFQVAAGDRLSNALLGNVTSGSNPTGVTLTNTVTGGSATAAAATTFGATGAGTVSVRFQGANLTSPVDIALTVAAGTTIEQALASLSDMTAGAIAIGKDEHVERIARAQATMRAQGIGAIYVGAGTNLTYFTGTKWHPSERMVGAIIPATGAVEYIAPAFEEGSLQDFMLLEGAINTWQEHESPYQLFVATLVRMGLDGGRIGIDESAPFFVVDGIKPLLDVAGFTLENARTVTAYCRSRKSAAELALMQRA